MSKSSRRRARRQRAKERRKAFAASRPTFPRVVLNEHVDSTLFSSYPVHLELLFTMLSTCRPHRSETEAHFLKSFIDPIPGMCADGFGNRYIQVGEPNGVCFTSHVDTVHYHEGLQSIVVEDDICGLAEFSESNCLGSDDTAGVWLMIEMIKAKRDGLYIFHRGEESGGLGAHWIVEHNSGLVKDIKIMISLDRKGYGDVITEQIGGMCASNTFAKSLADQLGGSYRPDPTGMFTDSAFYVDLIPECTNLSVGYFSQHSEKEMLDWVFLAMLREKLIALDVTKLVVMRKPGDMGDRIGHHNFGYDLTGRTNTIGAGTAAYWGNYMVGDNRESYQHDYDPVENYQDVDWRQGGSEDNFEVDPEAFITRNPKAVISLMRQYGLDIYDLAEHAGVDVTVVRQRVG